MRGGLSCRVPHARPGARGGPGERQWGGGERGGEQRPRQLAGPAEESFGRTAESNFFRPALGTDGRRKLLPAPGLIRVRAGEKKTHTTSEK